MEKKKKKCKMSSTVPRLFLLFLLRVPAVTLVFPVTDTASIIVVQNRMYHYNRLVMIEVTYHLLPISFPFPQ